MSRTSSRPIPSSFFRRPTERVARELLGCRLVRVLASGERLVVRIVETEAYLGAPDRASHAWNGRRTARNAALYLAPGHAYVYFVYGMHFCLNVVAGTAEHGGAVLFRAAVALAGEETMRANRQLAGPARAGELLAGPARLCQALQINRDLDGVRFGRGPLALLAAEPVPDSAVAIGPRIGVAYAGEAASWPLRFAVRGEPEVSRPRP
jgi:DNA-3-methyladenine glycosylase